MAQDVILDVNARLDKVEKQIKTLFSKTVYVNVSINPQSIVQSRRLLQTALDNTPIRLSNITIARGFAGGVRKSLQAEMDRGAPIVINKLKLSSGAAASFVQQVRQAMGGVSLNVPRPSGGGNRRGGNGGGGAYTPPLGKISGDATEFRKSLDAANARVLAFGASAGAIYLVAQALRDLVSSTVEVDKALREINVLLGLTDANLNKFGSDVFTIAKQTATGFKVAADAALEFSRQGLSVEETLSRTAAALNLTRLSGLDSVKAVEALTTALNSFNKEGLTAAEVADKLAAVDAVAATSAGGLAEGVSRVGSAAADAGVSFDELLGLIASAKQITGRSEAVIGNAFKTIFTRLDRGKVRDVLGGVVDIGENDSALQILQKLAGAYDGLSRQQQAYVAEITAGVFQINQFKAIISDLSSEFSVFGITQDAITKSTGVADKRVKELTQSLADLAQIAGTNVQQAFAKIGDIAFKDQASGFLRDFNTLFDKINSIDADSSGAQFGKNFIEGITNFVTGPGILLAATIGQKLTRNLSGQGKTAIRQVIGTDIKKEQQVALEKQINSLLEKRNVIQTNVNKNILNTSIITKNIIADINKENAKYQNQLELTQKITAELQKQNVRLGPKDSLLTGKNKQQSRSSRFFGGLKNTVKDPFNLALIASIGGEAAGGLFNQDTKGGRGGAAVASGVGQVGSFAALGSLLGPAGAGLGALIGAAGSFSDVVLAFTSDIPDIQKKFDKASTDFTTFSSLSQSILSLQSNVDNLSKGVANGSDTQENLNKAQSRLVAEVAKLPDELRRQYREAGKLSPDKAFGERSSILNQEGARRQNLVSGQANNLALAGVLDQKKVSQSQGQALSFIGKNFGGVLGRVFGDQIEDLIKSAGFALDKNSFSQEETSRLRELSNNLVDAASLTEGGIASLSGGAKDISSILSAVGASVDTDLGRLLERLKNDSPDAFNSFVAALRDGAQKREKATKEEIEASKKEQKVRVEAEKSLKSLQDNFELLSNSIKNTNALFDLIASNSIKNKASGREFGVNALRGRGELAGQLGNQRGGDLLNLQASIQENKNGALNNQDQILQETFQSVRGLFESGLESIFGANKTEETSKDVIANKDVVLRGIQAVFGNNSPLTVKIEQARKLLQESKAITDATGTDSKNKLTELNQDIDSLIKQSNEKLAQNQRELAQINKKLALDTLNANIERLIRAAEGAFGGISNFTNPANNPLFDQLKSALGQISGSSDFGEQGRGRFGALQALTGIAGQPFLSDTNADLAKTIQAYTNQLETQFSEITRTDGKGIGGGLDPQTIKEFKDSIRSLGGLKNIAQTQILKSLGVSSGGLFNQQIKTFQKGAIQQTPDSLLKALTDSGGVAQDETTVAVITQTQILGGKIDTTNSLLAGKSASSVVSGGAASSVASAAQSGGAASNRTITPFLTTAQLNESGTKTADAFIKSYLDRLKNQSNPELGSGVISRQPASDFDQNILRKKEQEKQIQLLSSRGYQNSLIGLQGREQAYNTVKQGGGTPDTQLFRQLLEKLGTIQEDKPLTETQQAAQSAIQVSINVAAGPDSEELIGKLESVINEHGKTRDRLVTVERKNNIIPAPQSVPGK